MSQGQLFDMFVIKKRNYTSTLKGFDETKFYTHDFSFVFFYVKIKSLSDYTLAKSWTLYTHLHVFKNYCCKKKARKLAIYVMHIDHYYITRLHRMLACLDIYSCIAHILRCWQAKVCLHAW